ncbi:MAG: DUF3787 domain-containing protein [Ruminococcaceae bacterium]|nr:DUF3787 domain-containing protein [Oscillospiraceae bacterium]
MKGREKMNRFEKFNKKNTPSSYETLAIADVKKKNKKTNTTIPTEDNVIQAREFVNLNKK